MTTFAFDSCITFYYREFSIHDLRTTVVELGFSVQQYKDIKRPIMAAGVVFKELNNISTSGFSSVSIELWTCVWELRFDPLPIRVF